ncbi:hypothetical protein ABGB07_28320 [Micromonosporaceae bacterium B7E4]
MSDEPGGDQGRHDVVLLALDNQQRHLPGPLAHLCPGLTCRVRSFATVDRHDDRQSGRPVVLGRRVDLAALRTGDDFVADEDTIRQVTHRFNEMGMASLDPPWAGGRSRQISPDEDSTCRRL